MRFSLRILLLLFFAAIFLAGWVGNTRQAAIERSTALNELMETGVAIKHGKEETFSTYWFEEEAKPPVVSIEQATQEIESKSDENRFDFAQVPELEKLVLFNDQDLSPESSKALVNLQVLEFRKTRTVIEHKFSLYDLEMSTNSKYAGEIRYQPADDRLVSSYADGLPVMPELHSLSVVGYVEYLGMPTVLPPPSVEGSWLSPENDGEAIRELTETVVEKIVESGELDSFHGRWIKGSDLQSLLKKAPNLKNLEVALHQVTPEAISALGERTSLESVNINLYDVPPEMYFNLSQELLGLPNLKSLEVEYPPIALLEPWRRRPIQTARLKHRDAILQELNDFEALTLSSSKLESLSLSHIAKLEVVDCPNLKTISSFEGSGQASLTVKRCDKLEKISVLALELHCEDCPCLIGNFKKELNPESRKIFLQNVGVIESLEIDCLNDLTVEDELEIGVGFQLKIGDRRSPVRVPAEIAPAESKTPVPRVSCKKLILETLSPAIIELMKPNGSLDYVELNMSGENPADQAARGWTPENMTAFFQQVSVKHLAISASHSFEENCFEQLDQCKFESLSFRSGLALSDFLRPGDELALHQRWNLKLPETLKNLDIQLYDIKEVEYMQFLDILRPDITIRYWQKSARGIVIDRTIGDP